MLRSPNLLGASSYSPAQFNASSNPPDYRDPDDLPSTIRETQETHGIPSQDLFMRFPSFKDDISEPVLAEGFVFQTAPKPGQYSGGPGFNFASGLKPQPIYNFQQDLTNVVKPSPTTSPHSKLPGFSFVHHGQNRSPVQPDNAPNYAPLDQVQMSMSPTSHGSMRLAHHESHTPLQHDRVSAQTKTRHASQGTGHQVDPSRHDQVASSVCGDLEAPTHTTPRRHRRHHPTRAHKNAYKEMEIQHRSRSQSSNISRKRSAVRKPRAHRDSERQKALHHVAEYWNHCMRMAEEDREEANHQIDQLQSHIQLQSRELNEAQNMLKDKHVHVQEMEKRFKELEAQGTNFTEQNRELTAEVSQLREELSDSNKRAAQLGEKYRAYKHKINEAINEQQDLYKKTKSHYEDMMTELRNVESKRASTSQEIEGVLQASKQKRDDMKKLFHELQDQSASELQQKNEAIDELKDRLKAVEAELLQERQVSMNICQQISDKQIGTEQAVNGVAAKIDTLAGLVSTQSQNRLVDLDVVLQLENKLDAIMGQMSTSAETPLCLLGDEQALQALADRIVARLAPTAEDVLLRQDQNYQLICDVGAEFSRGFTDFDRTIRWLAQQLGTQQSAEQDIRRNFDDAMEGIGAQLSQTQQSCNGVQSQLEIMKKEVCEILKAYGSSREADFSNQLGIKDAIIDERDRQLQLLADDYAAKVESMTANLLGENSAVNEKILESLASMTVHLDTVFEKERGDFQQKLLECDETNRNLQEQLEHTTLMLNEAKAAPDRDADNETSRQLNQERDTVSQLKQKIQCLEADLGEASELRGKWEQEIDVIDAMKKKLATACQRLPRVESMAAKLGNIVRLNGIIHSTAKYLSTEKEWVQQEIATRDMEDKVGQQDEHVEYSSCRPKVEGLLTNPPEAQQQHGHENMHEDAFNAEDVTCRKVQVRSPEDFDRPSPPPTVAQEQKRRREANRPRSIMRVPFGAGFTGLVVTEDMLPANDRKDHPSSSRNTSKSQHDTDQILEQIRSNFMPSDSVPPKRPSWKLPTVTDFQKSFEVKGQDVHTVNNSPGDLKGATIPVHPRTTGPKSRRPATRMYTQQFGI